MKKQFFRVKQLADQTFLRAEKSKQLSDELQEADQKVEYLRVALAAVAKRLPQSNSVQDKDASDKRLKKLLEFQLGIVMKEYGPKKDESSDLDEGLLRNILGKCGKAQVDLAKEMADHEIQVEHMVSNPIQTVLDSDIPAILKTKRTLSKLILDKDSAYNRYQTALKHGGKNDALKDEMDENEQKVEHCRDTLATEMFSLLRRESELAQYVLQLVKLQRAYHESALHTLEQLIPELEKEIGDSPVKAVYGCSLEEHLRLSKRQIALPLELCLCALWELGMTEEGLFRVAGGTSRVRRMKLSLDSGCFSPPLQSEYHDVHVIASALKSYLRELPEPLLTYELYDDWIRVARSSTEEQRLEGIFNVLSRLPKSNYDNLRYLIKFLGELSKNPRNKMTSSNIAIVMAPNLLWSIHEKNNGIDMSSATIVNSIVETLISNVDQFFPGELNIYQTFKREELFPESEKHHFRSSSNDTALIHLDSEIGFSNNLCERSSPPHGSPKPVSRKKNKPAPIPPLAKTENDKPPKPTSYPSGSSTINRTTYRQSKENEILNGKNNKMSVSVGTDDFTQTLNRRKSLDFDKNYQNCVPLKKPEGHINKSDISSPINPESTVNLEFFCQPVTIQTGNFQQITAQTGVVGKMKVASESLQQKSVNLPVAAPRTSLLEPQKQITPINQSISKSLNEIDIGDDVVQLRRTSKEEFLNRPNKPVVPERPATLRPSSFRVPRQTLSSGSESDSTTLERTHVYNVPDKQQVSIVQFKPGHDTQMAEKEKFLMSHFPDNHSNPFNQQKVPMPRLSLENNKLLSDVNSNCPEDLMNSKIVGNTGPGRPPKPEIMKSLERIDTFEIKNGNSQHCRTMSDGDLIDTISGGESPRSPTGPPASPRGCTRPPRPQPPPPPPPVRPKSDGESTDL